ncbi:MAG: EAL domain-containing protein [Paracoccaceae bacterium]
MLEITEHAIAERGDLLSEELRKLRSAGVRLAIDDLARSCSNLLQVIELSPDIIKLDRSLVTEIDAHPPRRALAAAAVFFAAESGAVLIAEDIETEAELRTLRKLGVQRVQGWALGRPERLERNGAAPAPAPSPG